MNASHISLYDPSDVRELYKADIVSTIWRSCFDAGFVDFVTSNIEVMLSKNIKVSLSYRSLSLSIAFG